MLPIICSGYKGFAMKVLNEAALKAQALENGNGVSVPAIVFACRSCGRVLKPGEGSRTCPECGGHEIESRVDPARSVVVRCAC